MIFFFCKLSYVVTPHFKPLDLFSYATLSFKTLSLNFQCIIFQYKPSTVWISNFNNQNMDITPNIRPLALLYTLHCI